MSNTIYPNAYWNKVDRIIILTEHVDNIQFSVPLHVLTRWVCLNKKTETLDGKDQVGPFYILTLDLIRIQRFVGSKRWPNDQLPADTQRV